MSNRSREEALAAYDVGGSRVTQVLEWELRSFKTEDIDFLYQSLEPLLPKQGGTRHFCGPGYNQLTETAPISIKLVSASTKIVSIGLLLPIQIGVAVYLATKRRWKAIWTEIPRPIGLIWRLWNHIFEFVKAPLELVHASIDQRLALCVNRRGELKLMSEGYTIMSHIWGETMGWQSTTGWGPVTLALRKKGMPLEQLERCIDRCDTEWLWFDQIAMPEVYEDLDGENKVEIERLRIDIINNLRGIYSRADKVMVIDTTMLRLRSSSLIDAAIMFCLGFSMTRLWHLTEHRIAKSVVLKTHDDSFDLDSIISFLSGTLDNDRHRYYPLLCRLTPLRPTPPDTERMIFHTDNRNVHLLEDIYRGSENRYTDVEIDQARALFPLLELEWEYDWTLQDGLRHITEQFPDQREVFGQYCDYRKLQRPL